MPTAISLKTRSFKFATATGTRGGTITIAAGCIATIGGIGTALESVTTIIAVTTTIEG